MKRTYIILVTLLLAPFIIVLAPNAQIPLSKYATTASLNGCAYGSLMPLGMPPEYWEDALIDEPDGKTVRLCGAYCYATALIEFDDGVYNNGVTLHVRHEDWRKEPQTFHVFFYNPEFIANTHIAQGTYHLLPIETEWLELYFSSDSQEFTSVLISGDTTTCGGEFDAVRADGYVRQRSRRYFPQVNR